MLASLLSFDDPLRFTEHRDTDGEAFYAEACQAGWEGLIAKLADSPYRAGRSKDWLKFKCENNQEFVIGGWTDPQGPASGFGALLLGYYDPDGKLAYAGKVGTGFDTGPCAACRTSWTSWARTSRRSTTATCPTVTCTGSGRNWWPDRVHRVDPGPAAAPPALPGPAPGQGRHRGGPGGTPIEWHSERGRTIDGQTSARPGTASS